MGFYDTSRAGIAKRNWGKHFQCVSSSRSATFGSDLSNFTEGNFTRVPGDLSGKSDTRAPFYEPDPRVFLLPPAAVPSRPDYDVFGVEAPKTVSVGTVLTTLFGILAVGLGSYGLGYQHGLHTHRRRA
jgi:hypothetical protein